MFHVDSIYTYPHVGNMRLSGLWVMNAVSQFSHIRVRPTAKSAADCFAGILTMVWASHISEGNGKTTTVAW